MCCVTVSQHLSCCPLLSLAGGVVLRNNQTGEVRKLPLSGLFFAIGHVPATKFLGGQLELDEYGYIITAPDSTATSIKGAVEG
jgi:thioredoxin reductase (NADPH)